MVDDKGARPGERGPLEGRYANCFTIGHNSAEFVIDFGQCYTDSGVEQYHTRIITNPIYAKALLETLIRAFDEYERSYGIVE